MSREQQSVTMRATLAARRATARRFATWLSGRCAALHLSVEALAEAASRPTAPVRDRQVSSWLQGQTLPSLHALPGLADALRVDIATLVVATGRPPADEVKLRFVSDPHGNLPARLRAWRVQVDLSVPQAAALAGVTMPNWYRFECGSRVPGASSLVRIADLMGVSPVELAKAARTDAATPSKLDQLVAQTGQPLATLLRQRRRDLGVSLEQVAAEVGVSRGRLRSWEWGRSLPELAHMIALADVLRADLVRILALWGLAGQDAEQIAGAVERPAREVGTLGAELGQARRRAGYSTYLLGPLLGTDRFVVSRWENDRQRPDLHRLADYARVTEANMSRLVAAYIG